MFIDPKRAASAILSKSEGSEETPDEPAGSLGLNSAASDLLKAFHEKDVPGIVSGLRSAFSCLESEEDEEDDGE